jgi:hypothetical protein
MRFICIRQCYWRNRIWKEGAVFEGPEACAHFAVEGAPVSAPKGEVEGDLGKRMTLAEGQKSVAGESSVVPGTLPEDPAPLHHDAEKKAHQCHPHDHVPHPKAHKAKK